MMPILVFLLFVFVLSTGAALSEDNYAMAVSLYGAKRYAESERLLVKQVTANPAGPGAADAHYYLASCYHYQRKFDQAKKEYELVVKNFPGSQAATYSQQALVTLNGGGAALTASAAVGRRSSGSDGGAGAGGTYIPDEEWIPYTRGPGGHFYVRAYINGHLQEMMLDTGAEMTVVSSAQWKQLGMALPKGPYNGAAQGVAGTVGFWSQEADVSLGKIKKHMMVQVADSPTVPPLLGESFFGDMEYTMDSGRGYIHFFRKGQKSSANAIPYNSIDIPFTHAGANMLVDAKINGQNMQCIFDTGAFGVLLGINQLSDLGMHIPQGAKVGATGGVGGSILTYYFPIDSIEVGDLKKTNFEIAVSMAPQSVPLLGQSFFGDRKYVIDNDKMLIRFNR